MVCHGYIVFPGPVVEVGFGEAPVATASYETAPVYVQGKDPVVFIKVYLSHAGKE